MNTSVVAMRAELEEFLLGAIAELGDPAAATCLVFAQWFLETNSRPVQELHAYWNQPTNQIYMRLHGDFTVLLDVSTEGPVIGEDGLEVFHIRKICDGVWALGPSLNIPGEIHAYVVLHGVSDPAPWERLVLLASECTPYRAGRFA